VADDPMAWASTVELERRLWREPDESTLETT
jgi:hypothetical protein